jgi:hypothetical protein
MGDDVKVKFGGDFSDVPKGADAAAKQAGTAIQNSFADAASKASKMFLGAFAVSSIVSSIYSGMREAGAYFLELGNTIKKTGANAEDLQVLGKAGRESGVGLDSIANALVKTNKFLNEATRGSTSQLETLNRLGFATDAVTVKNLKATDVIYKLADEIKRTGDATAYTEDIIKLFGKSGADLIPMLTEGSEKFKEIAENTKLFTDAEIKAGAAAEKAARAAGHAWDEFIRGITAGLGGAYIQHKLGDALSESIGRVAAEGERSRIYGPQGFGQYGTEEQKGQVAREFIRSAKRFGLNEEEALDYFDKIKGDFFKLDLGGETAEAIRKKIVEINAQKAEEKANAPEAPTTLAKSGAVVSTLQAIGAGDLGSIYSGTYQDSVVSATERTASATEQIAQNTNPANQQADQTPAKAGH